MRLPKFILLISLSVFIGVVTIFLRTNGYLLLEFLGVVILAIITAREILFVREHIKESCIILFGGFIVGLLISRDLFEVIY